MHLFTININWEKCILCKIGGIGSHSALLCSLTCLMVNLAVPDGELFNR